MKKVLSAFVILASIFAVLQKPGSATDGEINNNVSFPVKFKEVWGYLMRGEEDVFSGEEAVTDVCYFSCTIAPDGKLRMDVKPPVLPDINGKKRRVHIVIADLENTRLMNLVLNPKKGVREQLVADIIEVSKKFDGVQIDFEAVADRDSTNFLEFLKMIKAGLEPGKIFSVALPAKRIKVDDAYDYASISAVADRIYIMAYDQHWSTSKPGPVASLSWCKAIMSYALTVAPAEKIIMGIPLYGRSWRNEKITRKVTVKSGSKKKKKTRTKIITKNVIKSRSIKTAHIPKIVESKNSDKEYSTDTGFVIRYNNRSSEIIYCDDLNAIMEKFLYYNDYVDCIGFWRLGMENRDLWKAIVLDYEENESDETVTGAGE